MLTTLVMHRVVEDTSAEWTDISLSMLKDILDLLCGRQIPTTSISAWQGEKAVCLSFDDGAISDYAIVFPELVSRGMRATFFIVPEWVGKDGYLNWSQIREMRNAGMEIGSHGLTHVQMSRLGREDAWKEFDNSKKRIEEGIGSHVSTFAYPFGDHAAWCNRLGLEAGYTRLCSSRPGLGRKDDNILPRISVNRQHGQDDLPKLIEPSEMYLRWLDLFDRSRTVAKAALGRKLYVRIRNSLFR